jgi:hypothetical protein
VIIDNFEVPYTDKVGVTKTLWMDVRATWSAMSHDIVLVGSIKNRPDRPGIPLTGKGTSFLPLVNDWAENMRIGAQLLRTSFLEHVSKLLTDAATEHATLADCDGIVRAANHLHTRFEQMGVSLTTNTLTHLRVGSSLFDYSTHLQNVYDFDAIATATDAQVRQFKYFAPSHVTRGDIIRFLIDIPEFEDAGVVGRRLVNELINSRRHVALKSQPNAQSLWIAAA